jgi:hypothetical protein
LQAAVCPARQRDRVFVGLEATVWAHDAGDTSALDGYVEAVQAGLPAGKEARRPLHWPLVFPEVFADAAVPGFDAIIGNPPFLGGQKISGALGAEYLANLQAWDGLGARGSCDLAARFVLRADKLLGPRGQLGYVTTNTLLEGATLVVGLLQLERRGWTVRRGISPHAWPSASVNLSVIEIWASKAPLTAEAVLDGEPVPRLSVDLQPYLRETGRPESLRENDGLVFQGSIVLGLGFTLEPAEATALIDEDPRNADVLFPYVIGADINRRPDTSASRWIINFRDWPLERAERYPELIERLRRLVKPERERTTHGRQLPWWQFLRPRPELYDTIRELDHVLAISLHGNVVLPVRAPTGQVFSHACGVFALEDFASLALPALTARLDDLGYALDSERHEIMLGRAIGLTKLYNQVHDPAIADPAILRLRKLHEEIDLAVLAAYGWQDLDLRVGHYPTKIGVRWTVSPDARFQLLDRLLVENHSRAGAT